MTLNDTLAYGALSYIVVVSTIWLAIRKWRPGLIGLGKDFNDQRIDSVKLRPCPKCNKGRTENIHQEEDEFSSSSRCI
jgi:hypothetical protein